MVVTEIVSEILVLCSRQSQVDETVTFISSNMELHYFQLGFGKVVYKEKCSLNDMYINSAFILLFLDLWYFCDFYFCKIDLNI